MTEKRYKSVGANLECSNGMEYMLVKRDDGFNVCQVCSKYTAKEIVDELNNLADKNEQLKQENERYKRLSEIRNEQINNRILTIREFIDNCSNEDVKNALQDLFHSEVNEYDLAKENRKLAEENDSLKKWIEMTGG